MSQSQHYSAEVSFPKNWVNEKPKSLIELNTVSYAAVLPSLPPTIYSAFIFLASTPQPCVLLPFFLDNYASSGDEREVMYIACFSFGSSALNVSVSRGPSEVAPGMS